MNRHASRRRILRSTDIGQSQVVSPTLGTQTYREQTAKVGCALISPVRAANESTGALACASGAMSIERQYKSEHYLKRAEAATDLCHAIGDCHRDDAVTIMDAALTVLSMGSPLPVFMSAMNDARWWASLASPHELRAFALASFEAMHPWVRTDFLADGGRAAS